MPLPQEGDEYDPVCGVGVGEVVDLGAVREGLLRERDRFDQAVSRGRLIKRLTRIGDEAAGETLKDGGGELGSREKT